MCVLSYLYKIGFRRITKKKVEKWYRKQDIGKLIFALENGLYDIRIPAAKYLGDLKDPAAIPALRDSLNDQVKPVSLTSAESLMKLTNNSDIKNEVREKLNYWVEEEEKARNRKINGQSHIDIPKWKKRDWVAILKEMLKKPMRW